MIKYIYINIYERLKRRVYQLNLGKSSFRLEDLLPKNQAFNKISGAISISSFNFMINYLLNNNIIELNPSFNPALPESRTNPKYFLVNGTKKWPNVKYLAQQQKKLVRNKCISNSKTLGYTTSVNWSILYPENRFYVNNAFNNLIYKIV